MKVIELNEGEIPKKESAIYPNLGLQFGILNGVYRQPSCTKFDYNSYVARSKTLVPIIRDGVSYLVPFAKGNNWTGEQEFIDGLNDFITSINIECNTIIDKYIVDENIESGLGNGIDLIIYKYK